MIWDGVVTKLHKRHSTEIRLSDSVGVYIQTIALKKTLESISLEYRRGAAPDNGTEADLALRARAEPTSIAQACTGQTE
ncbi:hypothetical protein PAPHI01_2305 [Pancytospora philotis]|nr:hypothetical protein PAPHI01_2305 [Pancytospora philotis]